MNKLRSDSDKTKGSLSHKGPLNIATSNVPVSGGSSGAEIPKNTEMWTPALVPGNTGYVAHPIGASSADVNGHPSVAQSLLPLNDSTREGGYLKRPETTTDDTAGQEESLNPVLKFTPEADVSKTFCMSVVRLTSSYYTKGLKLNDFIGSQSFDDLPDTAV